MTELLIALLVTVSGPGWSAPWVADALAHTDRIGSFEQCDEWGIDRPTVGKGRVLAGYHARTVSTNRRTGEVVAVTNTICMTGPATVGHETWWSLFAHELAHVYEKEALRGRERRAWERALRECPQPWEVAADVWAYSVTGHLGDWWRAQASECGYGTRPPDYMVRYVGRGARS